MNSLLPHSVTEALLQADVAKMVHLLTPAPNLRLQFLPKRDKQPAILIHSGYMLQFHFRQAGRRGLGLSFSTQAPLTVQMLYLKHIRPRTVVGLNHGYPSLLKRQRFHKRNNNNWRCQYSILSIMNRTIKIEDQQ